jgi:hypothetical protein
MKKADLRAVVEAKKGFHSIIQDEVAPDNVATDDIEKRFFYINHINADGTAGKTYIYYLHDKRNDDAWFYNVEAETVDMKEPVTEQKKLDALSAYLKANFDAYFILRFDTSNNWAEADVFKLTSGQLVKSKVLAFKKGTNPITHLTIV